MTSSSETQNIRSNKVFFEDSVSSSSIDKKQSWKKFLCCICISRGKGSTLQSNVSFTTNSAYSGESEFLIEKLVIKRLPYPLFATEEDWKSRSAVIVESSSVETSQSIDVPEVLCPSVEPDLKKSVIHAASSYYAVIPKPAEEMVNELSPKTLHYFNLEETKNATTSVQRQVYNALNQKLSSKKLSHEVPNKESVPFNEFIRTALTMLQNKTNQTTQTLSNENSGTEPQTSSSHEVCNIVIETLPKTLDKTKVKSAKSKMPQRAETFRVDAFKNRLPVFYVQTNKTEDVINEPSTSNSNVTRYYTTNNKPSTSGLGSSKVNNSATLLFDKSAPQPLRWKIRVKHHQPLIQSESQKSAIAMESLSNHRHENVSSDSEEEF